LSIRDYKKELAREKETYKNYVFRAKKKDGEVERLEKEMNGRTFAEWVREKLHKKE